MHLVTEELDKGAPITYVTFPLVGEGFDPLRLKIEEKLKTKSIDEIAKEEGEENSLFKKDKAGRRQKENFPL